MYLDSLAQLILIHDTIWIVRLRLDDSYFKFDKLDLKYKVET